MEFSERDKLPGPNRLIEVLVVVAIVAVLAAVLFPPTGQREKTRPATCISNMKQLTLAMIMYTQDYGERYPPRQTTDSNGHTKSWRSAIFPYARIPTWRQGKSKDCFACPSNPMRDVGDIENDGFVRSYAVNSSGGGLDDVGGPFADNHGPVKLASITNPPSVILLTESTAGFNDVNPLFPSAFTSPSDRRRSPGHIFVGHGDHERTAFAFADGHVKMMNPLMTIGAADSEPLNFWTIDNSSFSLEDRKTAQYVLGYGVERSAKE